MSKKTLLAFFLILVSSAAHSFGDQTYLFERMWPTLKQPWYFKLPQDAASDAAGNIYVADTENHRIQKFTSDGAFITTWGLPGAGAGEFKSPEGIAVSNAGFVYVADTSNNRIQKFTADGAYITQWGSLEAAEFNPWAVSVSAGGDVYVTDRANNRINKFTDNGTFILTWGQSGQEDGRFAGPAGIAVAANGYVYVSDTSNYRIQKFTDNGTFVAKWGARGAGNGEFELPLGIEVDASGAVYVVDNSNNRIQKFTDNGTFITAWEGDDSLEAKLNHPYGVALDPAGHVYVADTVNECIKKFTGSGVFLTAWTSSTPEYGRFNNPYGIKVDNSGCVYVVDNSNNRVLKFSDNGTFRSAWGDFNGPSDIALGDDGSVYVSDTNNNRIQKFDAAGVFIKTWDGSDSVGGPLNLPYGIAAGPNRAVYVADRLNHRIVQFSDNGTYRSEWGNFGSEQGSFMMPTGVAVDQAGLVYVTDNWNRRVQKFDAADRFIKAWGTYGSGSGEFKSPSGIVVTDGFVYVADTGNHRIQVFSDNGTFVSAWGTFGFSPGQLNTPDAVAIGPDGKAYVTDTKNHRIQVFNPVEVSSNAKAIIVAGGGPYPGNNLWDTTQMCTNFAYRTLLYQGFTRDSIYYLSPDTDLDLDMNGAFDDVDNTTDKEMLKRSITGWAAGADSLVVYLADHGGEDVFRLNENQTLAASELAAWLDLLDLPVIIVYDACEAGSFLDDLQGDNRIVITSTMPGERAKFLGQGAISFSSFFWTNIFSGLSIGDAFEKAKQAINFAFDNQNPLISGSADSRYIGTGTQQVRGGILDIESVSAPRNIESGSSATLYANNVKALEGVARVWAVVWPPGYNPGPASNPVTDIPSFELERYECDTVTGQGTYRGDYGGFSAEGLYHISVYAMDRKGNTSLPYSTTLAKFAFHKAIIVAGAAEADLESVTQANAELAYQTLKAQLYADDDIKYMSTSATSSGFDYLPSLDNIRYDITGWAGDASSKDLVLYLTGSAGPQGLRITASETLTPALLGEWLNELQSAAPCRVVVICDADFSGMFMPLLAPPAGKERIVITSAGPSETAWFSPMGDVSFSSFFWRQIGNGATVYEAFGQANLALSFLSRISSISYSCARQSALLDDNGNGAGNDAGDGALARQHTIGMGIKFADDPPQIGSVSILQNEGLITIRAEQVSATALLKKVWGIVKPITYCPGDSGRENSGLHEIEMQLKEAGAYEGSILAKDYQTFKVSVYARDMDNNTSMSKETKMYQAAGGDIYEFDNDPGRANAIVLNHFVPQPHNFHYAGDEDWVKFYAIAGRDYTIEASDIGAGCLPEIELFDGLLNKRAPSSGGAVNNIVALLWRCEENGIYYVRLHNTGGLEGEGTEYSLKIYNEDTPFLGIVAGTIKDSATGMPLSDVVISTNSGYAALSVGGEYEIVHQAGGPYTLAAEAAGYEKFSESVAVISEGTTLLNILMRSASATTTTVSAGNGPGHHTSTTTTAANAPTTTSIAPAAPQLYVSPGSLDFGKDAAEKKCTAENQGDAAGSWSVAVAPDNASGWLLPESKSIDLGAKEKKIFTVKVSRNNLAPGAYEGSIAFKTSGGQTEASVQITMEVPAEAGNPLMALGKRACFVRRSMTSEVVVIRNSGTGQLTWESGAVQYLRGTGWLSVDPASGTLAEEQEGSFRLMADRKGLRPGLYLAMLPITSNGGSKTMPVIMWVPFF